MRMGFNWGWFRFGFGNYRYENSSQYSKGNVEIATDKIKDIEVYWTAGNVTVEKYDGKTISVAEENSNSLKDKEKLHYWVNNNKLIIRFQESSNWWKFTNNSKKNLTILIPKNYVPDNFKIDITSANLNIDSIQTNNTINIQNVSGAVFIENCEAQQIETETVSGKIEGQLLKSNSFSSETVSGKVNIQGNFKTISTESVSGKTEFQTTDRLDSFDGESVSGSITLIIPDLKNGFTASFDTVSGKTNCDFPTTGSNKALTYKKGQTKLEFETVSGSIFIQRAS